MDKRKKYNLYTVGVLLILSLVIYLVFGVWLRDSLDSMTVISLIDPMLAGSLGLMLNILLLLIFPSKIFVSWLKHIAWWYLFGTFVYVENISPFLGGLFSINRATATLFLMAILFITTLIYAVVMNFRLKKGM